MTPQELARIRDDAAVLRERAEDFAAEFYATLFDLDPSTRTLFPSDMSDQHRKLVRELDALVSLAAACDEDLDLRGAELGRRHVGYGVGLPHYDAVGEALLAALEVCVDGFDATHRATWDKLYRVVAAAMTSGVNASS